MTAPSVKRPFRLVGESVREQESLAYAAYLLNGAQFNASGKPVPAAALRTSPDATLTALAQLGALRTATSRSLVSIFDEQYQYVVAEATACIPLASELGHEEHGEDLWLCGTAIPRSHGVCDYTVCGTDSDNLIDKECDAIELPLTKVDDLGASSTFGTKPCCGLGSPAKFYAAVPIRTRRGINIGVFCVIHSESVPWDSQHTRVLRDISCIIMDHLEAKRDRANHRRSERMIRGLGSFLENRTTLSNWRGGSFPAAFVDQPEMEGSLNARQQATDLQREEIAHFSLGTPQMELHQMRSQSQEYRTVQHSMQPSASGKGEPQTPTWTFRGTRSNDEPEPAELIFGKAANLIRESIETEGCLLVDPTPTSFGSLSNQTTPVSNEMISHSSSPSSGEETTRSIPNDDSPPMCKVLGFSTSDQHSINGDPGTAFQNKVAQPFVASLLRRYPNGRTFTFDTKGDLLSSDSSDDGTQSLSVGLASPGEVPTNTRGSTRSRPWARQHEGSNILEIFPGARSVAFMPIWDPKQERWHAVQFTYTYTPSRSFTKHGELSFLSAFGKLTMEAALRHDTLHAEKAKSDVLSCISHELRSPLHGVLLSVELLNDTNLSVFQGNVSHTIETCCRTLVETLDHLLDYSRINNFRSTAKSRRGALQSRGLRLGSYKTVDSGMMSLQSNVHVDVLAEEVMESVFAGFFFQYMSIKQQHKTGKREHDAAGNTKLDSIRAMEEFNSDVVKSRDSIASGQKISVFFMIEPNSCWTFFTEGGAIRRVVMNLFGNALKYTRSGFIKVSLTQASLETSSAKRRNQVIITVTDTGIGMSHNFLDNHLFRPFSQENSLSTGTGLGLSIVKQIVSQLRGRISVKSQTGIGTKIEVTLPMRPQNTPLANTLRSEMGANESRATFQELRGLRVCLVGFGSAEMGDNAVDIDGDLFGGTSVLRNICTQMLQLEVIAESDMLTIRPDLILLSEDALINWRRRKEFSVIPTVVLCHDALVAYNYTVEHLSRKQRFVVMEYISQPLGPQKLGKSLLLVFNQWRETIDDSSDDTSPQSPGTSSSENDTSTTLESPLTAQSLYFDAPIDKSPDYPLVQQAPDQRRLAVAAIPTRPGLSRSPSGVIVPFLLVDDNAINLRILSAYMTKLKQKYQTASNGQEAFVTYKSAPGRCKCILMDISMPVMDGLEATRAIRTYEHEKKLAPVPIIALTGLASSEAQKEAFTSGIDLFLTKPVKLKELANILKSRGLLS